MVKFDRQELIEELSDTTGYIKLTLIGELRNDGCYFNFMGEDTIRVINPKK